MIPNAALQKALDGGWKPSAARRMDIAFLFAGERGEAGDLKYRASLALIALDPTFWQSLGDALGISGVARGIEFSRITLTSGDTQKFWDEMLALSATTSDV